MDIIEEQKRKEIQEYSNNTNKQSAQLNISNFTIIKVKGDETAFQEQYLKV